MSDKVRDLLLETLKPIFAAHPAAQWVWFRLNCPPCSLRVEGSFRAKDAFKAALRGISAQLKACRPDPLECVRVMRDGTIR